MTKFHYPTYPEFTTGSGRKELFEINPEVPRDKDYYSKEVKYKKRGVRTSTSEHKHMSFEFGPI